MCFKIIKKYKLNDYISNTGLILDFSFEIYNLICFNILFYIYKNIQVIYKYSTKKKYY